MDCEGHEPWMPEMRLFLLKCMDAVHSANLDTNPLKPFNDDDDSIYRLDSTILQRNWCGDVWCPKTCLQGLPKNQALEVPIENCNMTENHFAKVCRSPKDKFKPKALPLRKTTQPLCIHEMMMIMLFMIPSLRSSPDILEDNNYLTRLLVSINPKRTVVKVFHGGDYQGALPHLATIERNYILSFHWDLSVTRYK